VTGHVFISYSHDDQAYVERLAAYLEASGVPCWYDHELAVGDRWEHVIRAEIDQCAALVVVMTPASDASDWVKRELDRAARRKPIFPLLLNGEPFFRLSDVQFENVVDGRMPSAAFVRRVQSVFASDVASRQPSIGKVTDRRASAKALQQSGTVLRHPGGEQVVVGAIPHAAAALQLREGHLAQLRGLAERERTAVICPLMGGRGVGKTQLAAAYARQCITHGWRAVVWVNAETEDSLIEGLAALADEVGLAASETTAVAGARSALRWLSRQSEHCLVVYDNAVDPDLVSAWSPSIGRVQVVVTTVRTGFDAFGDLVEVDVFTEDEASQYLQDRTGLNDPEGAVELANELGRLPLALAQAAAAIGIRRRHRTFANYLARLRAVRLDEHLLHTPGDPYPHGTAEAIVLAVDQLDRDDPIGLARELLNLLSVLSSSGIDVDFLYQSQENRRVDQVRRRILETDEALTVLADRSMVAFSIDGTRVIAHRLMQRAVRELNQKDGNFEETVRAAAAMLEAVASDPATEWARRSAIADLAMQSEDLYGHSHVLAGASTRRRLLDLRADAAYQLNRAFDPGRAVIIGDAVVADMTDVLGQAHPTTLVARQNVADAYRASGRLQEAIDRYTALIADREDVLGDDDLETIASRRSLATAFRLAHRLNDAIALYERTAAEYAGLLGGEDPDTLATQNDLAGTYRLAGRIDDAIALYEQTLAIRERILGRDHRETMTTRSDLACSYRAGGRLGEALDLHEQTLAARERVLGKDHPDALTSRANLAFTYLSARWLQEAIDLYERGVADHIRLLGEDHPQTLAARLDLARAYATSGRTGESITLYEQTYKDALRLLGRDHPTTLALQNRLARAYALAGNGTAAAVIYEQILHDYERLTDASHPLVQALRTSLYDTPRDGDDHAES
jgi:tetratricopeptide (TPR) repeat protein